MISTRGSILAKPFGILIARSYIPLCIQNILKIVSVSDSFIKHKTFMQIISLTCLGVVVVIKLANLACQFTNFPSLQVVIIFVFENCSRIRRGQGLSRTDYSHIWKRYSYWTRNTLPPQNKLLLTCVAVETSKFSCKPQKSVEIAVASSFPLEVILF